MLGRTNHLLLVEDDDQIREVLTIILTRSGYGVRPVRNGFEALKAIQDEMPDILLSDLYMPGMSGFELLHVVECKFPTIRAVAMSGAFSGEKVPAGVAAEAFYEKGTSPHHLLQILRTIQQYPKFCDTAEPGERTLWVTKAGVDVHGKAYALLACEECLRAFAMMLHGADGRSQHTACPHCKYGMEYRVIDGAGPETKPVFLVSLISLLPCETRAQA